MLHDCCAALLGKERCNEEAKWSLRAAADSAATAAASGQRSGACCSRINRLTDAALYAGSLSCTDLSNGPSVPGNNEWQLVTSAPRLAPKLQSLCLRPSFSVACCRRYRIGRVGFPLFRSFVRFVGRLFLVRIGWIDFRRCRPPAVIVTFRAETRIR